MADTNFSGDLMGLDNGMFNPNYHSVTTVKMNMPASTDMSTVDYLVHGKPEHMVDVPSFVDVSLGYVPYHTASKPVVVESSIVDDGIVRFNKLNPKWYDVKKWNKMMVAMSHRIPATCSFANVPSYNVFHIAPTHNDVYDAVIFEFSTPMVELVPLTVKSSTRVVFDRDESRDNMEYTAEYAAVTGRVLSPFFGLHGMELIDAKLNYIGGFSDHESDDVDAYDPLDGVDFVDESDDDVKHALVMKKYTDRLLTAANRVDNYVREHNLPVPVIGWAYKMSRAMTAAGMMDGCDALTAYKPTPAAFVFNEFERSHGGEHYTVDEMNDLATHSMYVTDYTVMDEPSGRNHCRAGHWMTGDVVETLPPEHVAMVYGASVLNLVKLQPIRNGVHSKFPIANARSYVYNTDGFEWELSFNSSDKIGYAGFYFSVPNMTTHKLSNTGVFLHHHVKRVVKMTADVEHVLPFLTSEPVLVRDLVELTGMTDKKLAKLLKTAAAAGIVKSVTIKNKSTNFMPRAAYYL